MLVMTNIFPKITPAQSIKALSRMYHNTFIEL